MGWPWKRPKEGFGWAHWRWAGRVIATVGLIGGLVAPPAEPVGAQVVSGPEAFSGTAAAMGAQMKVEMPGFAATDVPMDSGGPTAQASLDSLGTSLGYAAFPDPGQFVTTLPGLATGLFSGGAGGLPPIALPPLPGYPLFVASDSNNPEKSIGSGPYRLTARSSPDSASAEAISGLRTEALGNVALAESSASVSRQGSTVVSTATTRVQGLSVGPLSVGEITSTASMVQDAGGTITPSTSMEIAGLKVGGVAVAITPSGLNLLGPTAPLPINDTLAAVLAGAKISATVVTAQTFQDRVVAPVIKVSMPFATANVPNVGTLSGTWVMTVGGATASMTGAPPSDYVYVDPGFPPGSDPTIPESGSGSVPARGQSPRAPGPRATPDSGRALNGNAAAYGSPSGSLQPAGSGSRPVAGDALGAPPVQAQPTVVETGLVGLFDVRSVYLMLAGSAVAAWIVGQLIRLIGVRRPWTSFVG